MPASPARRIRSSAKHSWGVFVQDNWKITRKLTLDYGLRWDWQQAPHEIHGTFSMFAPQHPESFGRRIARRYYYAGNGTGRCGCDFTPPYMYAIGPRLGAAYQIDAKTVIRAGWGFTYGATAADNFIGNNSIIGLGSNSYSMSSPVLRSARHHARPGTAVQPRHPLRREPESRPQTIGGTTRRAPFYA